MKKTLPILLSFLLFLGCKTDNSQIEPIEIEKIAIPSYTQRAGDPQKGYEYLTTGNYISSGIPYNVFTYVFGDNKDNFLNRTGDNAKIKYDFTAVTAPNGTRIVAPNCMQCHAAKINNKFVLGLGNHSGDFTIDRAEQIPFIDAGLKQVYGENSKEWEAYQQYRKSILAIGPNTITENIGPNPADKITFVLAAHRDKNTFEWRDTPYVTIPKEVVPTDVPAWWLMKKKNALFYHAFGREDLPRYMIFTTILTSTKLEQIKEVDKNMPDILAYIKTIEPPKYPFAIDNNLATSGKQVFNNKCSGCHGTYGDNESYPNFLIPLSTIKTDPALSDYFESKEPFNEYFRDWLNNGWFGSGENALLAKLEGGYVAPPLDGVWATAPYFHNGSVPTIESVLNSKTRPKYWSRTFIDTDYNKEKVGWNYTNESSKKDIKTYDTTIYGYGNQGHYFGDNLSEADRKAVIEYLKTL